MKLLDALNHIDCSSCSYSEWIHIGMALKNASENGEPVGLDTWDEWSATDPERYKPSECEKKWNSFKRTGITKSTIYYMATQRGWKFKFDDPGIIIDEAPDERGKMLYSYLTTLFEPEDRVNFVLEARFDNEKEKWSPANKGNSGFTAGDLETLLERYNFNVRDVLGDTNKEAGAWIRINPVDGNGVGDKNITKYKYALIESDDIPVEEQFKKLVELKLPCAAIVYSGKRSLHAVVDIDALSLDDYRERVEWLYKVLEEQGFKLDPNNKNPSRMTRLPGVERSGALQALVDTNVGLSSFDEFKNYIENGQTELPEIEKLTELLEEDPELADELIEGILRQGHKMIIAGPSKAGKSFLLIELATAIAEGDEWIGHQCQQGKVLYLNLEVDRASFYHRMDDVYKAKGIDISKSEGHANNIDIWNLRGKVLPLEKLSDRLIQRCKENNYKAIILDPIYKVQSGDENSAGDIAKFTNELDKIVSELSASLIYCHHHSKGAQGHKSSIDRASGSGVFARDADALTDLIEIDTEDEMPEEYKGCSMWQAEFTLREFPPIYPTRMFFKFPLHIVDEDDLLENAEYADTPGLNTRFKKGNTAAGNSNKRILNFKKKLDGMFDGLALYNEASIDQKELMEMFNIKTLSTFRKYLREVNNTSEVGGNEYYRKDKKVYRRTKTE